MTIERHIYKLKAINHCAMINFIIPLCTQPVSAGSFLCELICRSSIPIDFIVTNRVTVLTATIAGVAFDGVDASILHLLHNANMIGRTILAAIIPIEKDNVARARLIAVVLPQSARLEPRHPLRCTGRKLRNDASFNIAALVSTPAHKASAPLNTGIKTVPRPVWLSAHISNLREGDGYDLIVRPCNPVKHL